MKMRALTLGDMAEVKRCHDLYYPEFEFPRFLNLMSGFIIEDNDGKMTMAGGVEMVGEAVLVTNKEQSRIKIGKALVKAQDFLMYTCRQYGVRDMYAFVKDKDYAKHLIQHGFRDADRALLLRMT